MDKKNLFFIWKREISKCYKTDKNYCVLLSIICKNRFLKKCYF